jgi:uncharacterized protein (TIGR03083 family)
MPVAAQDWISAFRTSHDRLVGLVGDLDVEALESQSFDTEWSIGQVLSHLGSQAEIMDLFLLSVIEGLAAPGGDAFPPVWDVWNAKGPLAWRDDSLAANARHIERLEALSPAEVDAFTISMFGSDRDLVGFLKLRVPEHTLHTWDIAVALDPTATLSPASVPLVVDNLAMIASRTGKGSDDPFTVKVTTTEPARDLLVVVGESVAIEPFVEGSAYDQTLVLPAEAFIRLAFGRLDPARVPDVATSGTADLATLRAVFPGV